MRFYCFVYDKFKYFCWFFGGNSLNFQYHKNGGEKKNSLQGTSLKFQFWLDLSID